MTTEKKRRRQYGTGAVYLRASDNRWVGTIEAGWTAKGTRRRVTVSAKTKSEAQKKLRDKQRQIDAEGLPSRDTSARTTVKVFAERWLEQTVRRLRPSSYATDRGAVANWIIPTIGHKRFDMLTPGDIRAVASAQRAAGRSTSTALRTHSTLMTMLKAATLDGHPVPQRVMLVERPVPSRSDRDALPIPAALAVLEQAAMLPHGSRWLAAFLQGMRQGECLGLTWELVNLDARIPTFDVSWQLQPLPYLDKHDRSKGFRVPDKFEKRQLVGRMHLVRPKTEKGQRLVPLVPPMVTAMRAWREVAPESPHDLVWPALDGSPADAKADLEEWQALQFAAGWTDDTQSKPRVIHPAGRWYHTHEARHTTATLLLEAGVDPEVIKAILGHSSIVTQRSYQHVNQEMSLRGLAAVAERLALQ